MRAVTVAVQVRGPDGHGIAFSAEAEASRDAVLRDRLAAARFPAELQSVQTVWSETNDYGVVYAVCFSARR